MNDTSPFSVCRSVDVKENDDFTNLSSLLTWPCGGDEAIREECDLANLFATKQNADPNYCNELDGTYPSQMYQPRSLSRPDQILVDTVPLQQDMQRQELLDLKLQIAKQKEEMEILSLENEVIKAEKTHLIDDLALAINVIEERSISPETRKRRFSLPGFGIGANNGNGGSMQMLLDTNAKLMTEHVRLRISEDGIRKSFHSYMKDSLQSRNMDKQTIKTLQRENELLQHQRLSVSEKFMLDLSEHTAKTSLESSFTEKDLEDLHIDSSQHSTTDIMLTDFLHSIPEQEFKFDTSSDDDWVIDVEEVEASNISAICNKAARMDPMPITSQETANTFARSKSEALLVDFGEPEARRSKRTDDRRPCHNLTEGTARNKSEILLVGFGEVRRSRSMASFYGS